MSGHAEPSCPVQSQQIADAQTDNGLQSNELNASKIRTMRLAIVALLLSAAGTVYMTRDRSERFAGYLRTEKQTVVAPVTGVLEWVDVKTGQVVLPGHELFTIRDTQIEDSIAAAQDELTKLTSERDTTKAEAQLVFEQRLVDVDQDVFETKLQLAEFLESEYQHKFEATAVEDYVDLFDALASTKTPGFNLTSVVLNPALASQQDEMFSIIRQGTLTNQLETLQAKIALCENHLRELNDRKDKIKKQIDTIYMLAELEERVAAAQAKLDDVSSQESTQSVKAVVYGMAGRTNYKAEDKVQVGDMLTELFDRDREFIQVQLPSRVICDVKAGTILTVRFPGDIEREGKVESVPPQVSVDGNTAQPESLVELRVLTTGKPWPAVPIGSTIYVSLLEDGDDDDE